MKQLQIFFLLFGLGGFIFTACESDINPDEQLVNPIEPVVLAPTRGISFEIPQLQKRYFYPSYKTKVFYETTPPYGLNKLFQVRLMIYGGRMVKNTGFFPFTNQSDSIFSPDFVVALSDTTKIKENYIYLTNQYSILNRYSFLSSVTFYNYNEKATKAGYIGVYASEVCQKGHTVIRKFGFNATKDSMVVEGTFEAEVCRQKIGIDNQPVVDDKFNVLAGKFSLAFTTI